MAITIITTSAVTDDSVTLAKMAPGTDGNLITYDASGNPAAVATGSAGQVLTSAGAGAPPTFAAAGASGRVLQVVYAETSTEINLGTSTWTDVLSANITPSATSSKILVLGAPGGLNKSGGDTQLNLRITRDGSEIAETKGLNTGSGAQLFVPGTALNKLHEPNSTSSLTFKIQVQNRDGNGTVTVCQNNADTSMTLLEIDGS